MKSVIDRIMDKVTVDPDTECCIWHGALDNSGYGLIQIGSKMVGTSKRRAHRVAYEETVGPIPRGMRLAHTCGNSACVNPIHLKVVTQGDIAESSFSDNPTKRLAAQKSRTHCARGHELASENTRVNRHGWRYCKACHAEDSRRRRSEARQKRQGCAA